jgi:Tol biopolymer transport system component/DNA-binding winged helix-turn-helix (wHTH) protein
MSPSSGSDGLGRSRPGATPNSTATGRHAARVYEFGPFRLDTAERLLQRAGQAIPLAPKAFDLLVYFLEHRAHLLERQQLLHLVWPDTYVEEANLSYTVSQIRKALGDSEHGERYIETIPKHGYRFVANVREVQPVAEAAPAVARHRGSATLPIAAMITLAGAAGVALYVSVVSPRSSTHPSATELVVVPVTSLPGRENQPAFSPDGNQIAFVWERAGENNPDIYVKLVDTGEPLQLTTNPAPDFSPVWSPDGSHLAFAREGDASGIYLVPALGGAERKVGDLFGASGYHSGASRMFGRGTLSYSPDGKYLAVADKTSATEPFGIFLLALDTGGRRRLTSAPPASAGDESPAFSPDGTTVAFTRLVGGAKEIYVVPVTGGQPRRLTFEDNIRPGSFTDGLAWTPDGRDIVFASNRSGSFQLWRVPVTGGTPVRIGVYAQHLSLPTVSRDGKRLAWVQSSYDTNIWHVPVPEPGGPLVPPTPLIVSTAADSNPQYSPDGQRIVFGSLRSGTPEIWSADHDGRRVMRLTNMGGPVTGTPRWSPDGKEIAFDSMVAANRDIYVVSANGGKPRQLTTEAAEDTCPSWSGNGQWIYFGSSRSGRMQIWKMPSTGGAAVQVTRQGGFEGFESTDGKYFYYAKGRDVAGIWRVEVEGGVETPVVDHHGAGFWRSWAVTETGIYFATAEGPASPIIEFFSFATGDITLVAVLERPISARVWGLAVSPDRRSILSTQIDLSSSDVMVTHDFR